MNACNGIGLGQTDLFINESQKDDEKEKNENKRMKRANAKQDIRREMFCMCMFANTSRILAFSRN